MSLESGNYISDLVITNPPGTDPKSQGDDHLRLIKKTVQQSFPQVNGPVNISTDASGGVRLQGGTTAPTAGQIGEYIVATNAGPVDLPSGTFTDVAAFTLQPGVWDVSGNVTISAVTGPMQLRSVYISTQSGAVSSPNAAVAISGATSVGFSDVLSPPATRLVLTNAQIVYLIVRVVFSGGSSSVSLIQLNARRVA